MKKYLLFFLILTGTVMAQQNKKIFPYDYTVETLNNGLKVILIPMESPGVVAYYSVVRTGSRDEWEPGKSGFAHFFEHMMFRGTEKYPGPVYDSIVTSIGADANAYTDDDLTVYHLKFAAEDLETVMDLESDRFQNLNYSKEQFQTESGAVYGEYRKGITNPFWVAFEKLHDMAYDEHTYKHTTIGFEEDIKNMPNLYDYSLSFYDRYYRPENVVVVIVGDVDADKTLQLAKEYYGEWESGYVKPQITEEPPQKEARSSEVSYEGKTLPIILFGYKSDEFNVDDQEYLATHLLASLAFGEVSDIYKKLVLNEQKVQFVAGSPAMTRDPGLFYIYSMVKSEEEIEYVKDEILKTLDYYKNNLVDENKLNDLKKREKYSFLMNLDNPNNVASKLPKFITLTGGIDVIDSYYRNLEKVTPKDIQRAAEKYFKAENRNLIVLKGEK